MRNRIWAIVPVKPLYHAKSRLAAVLDTAQRQALVVALLRHTLSVLAQVDELATVLVVSADPVVCTMGRTSGARILREDRAPGLNASLNEAGDFASAGGAAGVLIIPADLPRLRPESIAALLAHSAGPACVVIAPDRNRQGTNSLLIKPPGAIPFQFGAGSFLRHTRSARDAGLPLTIVDDPNLALDIDLPEDLPLVAHLL